MTVISVPAKRAPIVTKDAPGKPVPVLPANGIIALKGAGKAAREDAYVMIAPLAFVEAESRDASIANLRIALGKAPSIQDISIARDEYIIGRTATRLTALPKDQRLEAARDIVLHYSDAPKDGITPRPLRKNKKGRRTPDQQRAVGAAREYFSQLLAETPHGKAKPQSVKNKGRVTRKPQMAGSRNIQPEPSKVPSHSTLVRPEPASDRAQACNHVFTQAAALLAYANKNAKLLPTDIGQLVCAFQSGMIKAMALEAERQAARDIVNAK